MEKAIILSFITLIILALSILLEHYLKEKNKDNLENNYIDYLPGCNCGECGYNSCLGMINAMEDNKKAYLKCKRINNAQKEKLTNMVKES